MSRKDDREALKKRFFRKYDKDKDGKLNKMEMRELAGGIGFDGGTEDWVVEYNKLCSEYRVNPVDGVPELVMMNLLDDETDVGCYCTDEELVRLLGEEEASSAPRRQQEHGKTQGTKGDRTAQSKHGRGGRGGNRGNAALGGVLKKGTKTWTKKCNPDDLDNDEKGDGDSIFFAGANFRTTEPVLKSVFEEVGPIREFTLFRMQDGRSRGMGRVRYSKATAARHAITVLNQREVGGRPLLVKLHSLEDDPTNVKSGGNRVHSGNAKIGTSICVGRTVKGKKARNSSHGDWQADDNWNSYTHFNGQSGDDYQNSYYEAYEPYGDTVFFAGASFDSSAHYLRKVFEEAGRVEQFWLFHLADGRSRGMGVVQYHSAWEAQGAVKLAFGRVVDGRELFVKIDDVGMLDRMEGENGYWGVYGGDYGSSMGRWGNHQHNNDEGKVHNSKGIYGAWSWNGSQQVQIGNQKNSWRPDVSSNRIFFAGAPFNVSEAEIRAHFEEIGHVTSFTIFRLKDGRHRGMGKCSYASNDIAAQALKWGIEIEYRPLFLQEDTTQFSRPDQEVSTWGQSGIVQGRSRAAGSSQYDQSISSLKARVQPRNSVFFSNVPFEITEKYLVGMFESVGEVKNFFLYMTPDGKSRGRGVVEYTVQAAVFRAYKHLHEANVGGRLLILEEYQN